MYLITPTLLNAFDYYVNFEGKPTEAEDGTIITAEEKEASVREEFLNTLAREKFPPTPAMQEGVDFENRVHAYCQGAPDDSEQVREIGDIVKGGLWQQPVKRPLDDFMLYARADVIKRDTIYDIKRPKSYEVGKYQQSTQHRIELWCTGMPKFSYLLSDGRGWWREDYFNHTGTEQEIRHAIWRFTGYLEHDPEAKKLYYGKWKALESAGSMKIITPNMKDRIANRLDDLDYDQNEAGRMIDVTLVDGAGISKTEAIK